MSRHFVIFMLAVLCAASIYADNPDEGGWEPDGDNPLGDPGWWEGDGEPPEGPHGQLPPWLWFILNGRPGADGRDGRKGDTGAKGDCGDPGDQGPKGMPGLEGITGYPGESGENGVDGAKGCKGFKGNQGADGPDATPTSGAPVTRIYTRWGVPTCPEGASVAYSGRAGTSYHNNAGAGANIVCLQEEFTFSGVWQPIDLSESTVFGSIVGIEYQASPANPPALADPLFNINNDNVACAVCTVEANAVYMHPGRTTCLAGWSVQYKGFIMSELRDQSAGRESENYRTQFVCVDEDSEEIVGLENSTVEARLAHVHVACDETDILECTGGNYEQGQLSCIVCSRDP